MVIDLNRTEREVEEELVGELVEMLTGPGYYTPAKARRMVAKLRAEAMREAAAMVEKGAFAGTRAGDAIMIRARADEIEEGV